MTKGSKSLVALAVAAAFAVGGYLFLNHRSGTKELNRADFENDATEALVRYVLQTEPTTRPTMFFLAYGPKLLAEPSYNFLARFSDQHPRLQGFDRAVKPGAGTPVDYATGTPGIVIQLASVHRKAADEVDVEVVLSNHPPGKNHFTYRLIEVGGEWRVRRPKP